MPVEMHVKALEHASFPQIAGRINALYNEEEDALLLGMLGQEYVVRHDGIYLHGQKAPDSHAAVILDYLFSPGDTFTMLPWRAFGDFSSRPSPDFRKRVELPIIQYVSGIISRAGAVLPLVDAKPDRSIIASDMAVTVRALPKVYLHVELSQDVQEFPAEAWVLFSYNANEFLSLPGLQSLAELLKDRLLSLARIY
jgi:hypothetical protein